MGDFDINPIELARKAGQIFDQFAKMKKEFEDYLKTGKFEQARKMLLEKITANVLDWKTVKLDGGHSVQVCLPVRVQGPDGKMYYVPVRPSETWRFARQFNALPLTSAVFDQYHNQATYVPRSPNHDASQPSGPHFHTFSEYLDNNQYQSGMKSGAHKLWILSAAGRSVNRGFYMTKPKDPVKYKKPIAEGGQGGAGGPGGPKLNPSYWLIQVRGTHHTPAVDHWDYSQLLQLMRSDDFFGVQMDPQNPLLKLPGVSVPSIKLVKLREAVSKGLSEVWDEPKSLEELKKEDILP